MKVDDIIVGGVPQGSELGLLLFNIHIYFLMTSFLFITGLKINAYAGHQRMFPSGKSHEDQIALFN